jgi:hypothetical protein
VDGIHGLQDKATGHGVYGIGVTSRPVGPLSCRCPFSCSRDVAQ